MKKLYLALLLAITGVTSQAHAQSIQFLAVATGANRIAETVDVGCNPNTDPLGCGDVGHRRHRTPHDRHEHHRDRHGRK